MKKLNLSWEGIHDDSGFLHSFAKSLSCAVKNSPYSNLYEDIIATSGFAFRMWAEKSLCPSAMSIWSFQRQKEWIANGGLDVDVINRTWGQNDIELERRQGAIELIKRSIDNGVAVVAWDIGVPEWGLITGYDNQTEKLSTLLITYDEEEIGYAELGNRDLPILNVLAINSAIEKSQAEMMSDTIMLAKSHLNGEEWCGDNMVSGIQTYDVLIQNLENGFTPDSSWNMEYYIGTYSSLKWYAWRFFEKYGATQYADIYKKVYELWAKAFQIKKSSDISLDSNIQEIIKLLKEAKKLEQKFINA